jgi:hypothetical protein
MQPGAQLPFMQSIGAADAGAYTTDRNALRLNWMYGSPGGLGSTYGMPRVGTADAGAYTTDRNALRLNWMYGSPGGLGSTYGMPRVGAEPTAPTSTDLAALPIDMRAVVACVLAECKCPTAQDVVKSVLDQPQGLQYLEEAERIAAGGSGLRMAFTRNWAHNQANCDLLCRAMLAAAKAYPECVLARAWADTCCAVLPNLASAAAAASAPKTAGTFTGPTIGAFSTKAYHEMGRKIQVGADTVAALASSPPVALAKSPPSPEANLIAARSIAQQIEEIHHLLPEGHAMLVSLLVEEVCRALRLLDLAGRDPKVMAELARQVRGIGRKSKKLKGALLLAEELQTKGTVRLPPLG